MLGVAEQRAGVGLLDDLTGVHHRHPVGHLGHDPEVVGDEDDAHAEIGLELPDELEDLGLDRDVEGGGGLVRHEQIRIAGQGHGDHHPLGLSARELVRIGTGPAPRVGDADAAEHVDGPLLPDLALDVAVDLVDLADLETHPVGGIQRRQRLLEDHADLIAPQVAHLGLGLGRQLLALEADGTVDDPSGRRDQPEDRERRDALARSGLPDQAQHLTGSDVEIDAIDGLDDAVRGEEPRAQPRDLEDRPRPGVTSRAFTHHRMGLPTLRRRWPEQPTTCHPIAEGSAGETEGRVAPFNGSASGRVRPADRRR